MELFPPLPHDVILRLLIELAVLLCTARALGELAGRLGQPSVVGEILAGIVLGPSLLSSGLPIAGQWIVPTSAAQAQLLDVFGLVGAMSLLLITGLETDLTLIRRHARTALGVSAGGITVTFSSGFLLGQLLPDALLADPSQRLVFALFVATAMSISAIPVIAKVLMDLGLMRRDIGQTILAAGMSDDTTGWILLSLVAGLASGAAVTALTVLQAVGRVALFLLLSLTVGRWLVKRALDFVQDEVASRDRLLTLVVVLTFGWGGLSHALHLEAVLGAFAMGILLGRMPRLPEDVRQKLQSLALGIFAPIFFAVAGLKMDLLRLLDPFLLTFALVVIAVATIGKVVGTYLGARLVGGRDHWTALSFGAALNARGAMEIIVASIGLSLGILSQDMFSIIVLTAVTTSMMAPAALRWTLSHVIPGEEELRRLGQEELSAGSRIASIHRVLVPIRYRPGAVPAIQAAAACLLERMSRKLPLSVTLLTVTAPGDRASGAAFLERLAPLFPHEEVVRKAVEGTATPEIILEEAAKGYDLIVLGAPETSALSESLFTSLVDYLLQTAPCLTMVVKVPDDHPRTWQPRHILVPTNGTVAAKHAAELGFAIADEKTEVQVLHVMVEDPTRYDSLGRAHKRRLAAARDMVAELRTLGSSLDVATRGEVLSGQNPDEVILEVGRQSATDLILVGTAVRVASDRLYLGSRVEGILRHAPCPVVVVNTP